MIWLAAGLGVTLWTTHTFALGGKWSMGFLVVGVIGHFLNALLIRHYIQREMPESLDDGTWELTAGLGIVPRWVSVIGLLAYGIGIGAAISLLWQIMT